MPALNFKKQFVPKILSLEKSSTIRGKRKNPINFGDTLILYSGMRTKQCVKIGSAICNHISTIRIEYDTAFLLVGEVYHEIDHDVLQEICKIDGFNNYGEMRDFFQNQYGLPFEGELIEWTEFTP